MTRARWMNDDIESKYLKSETFNRERSVNFGIFIANSILFIHATKLLKNNFWRYNFVILARENLMER